MAAPPGHLSMLPLALAHATHRPLRILCLGAHSDDLEIGCGGAVLHWLRRHRRTEVSWVVLSAPGKRADEAKRSAATLLAGAARTRVVLGPFTDGRFPAEFREIKAFVEDLKRTMRPDLILTHRLEDRHQDHRVTAEITWQTWRDHLVLEYEIPKYEGDLGQPNFYVPLTRTLAARKVRHLLRHFGSQRSRDWFRKETFESLLRLRGMECRAPTGLAEGFHVRKAIL
jgi:LmbE family N-acetylglucosaminyl deacetylase